MPLRLVDQISDVKRKVISLLDQVFPEYETLFSDIFGVSSRTMLTDFSTPEEFLAVDTEKLASVLARTSWGRLGLSQAHKIQDAARQSFGVKLGVEALVFEIRQLVAQTCRFCWHRSFDPTIGPVCRQPVSHV